MRISGPDPKVLIVPGGLLLELFVVAQYASYAKLPDCGVRILGAIRRLRPDISEFSSYYALALIEQGQWVEARDVLEDFVESGGEESSLLSAILAKLLFFLDDPGWVKHATDARRLVVLDGGGAMQNEILQELPGFEVPVGSSL